MLSRLMLLSYALFISVITPSFATVGSLDLESQISLTGASKSFYIGDSALRTYAMLVQYIEGRCPTDVSPENLLEAVKYPGNKDYDPIREKASQAEVDDLRTRLQNAYREGDPDITYAMHNVVTWRHAIAKRDLPDTKIHAPYCLDYARRTLDLFLFDRFDFDLLPNKDLTSRLSFIDMRYD